MQHRFFLGMNPPKYQFKKTGAIGATRLDSTLRRENLSLTGCSSAEPVSVSVQHMQNSYSSSIFTTCQKSQPFTHKPIAFLNSPLLIIPDAPASLKLTTSKQSLQGIYWNFYSIY